MKLFRHDKKIDIANIDSKVIYAPITGKRIDLKKVEDNIFSRKIMGDGVAIEPSDNKLYSPVSGTVTAIFPTKHAIGIEAENGANVIIHVGIDTVELNGEGFTLKVKKGDIVKAGELLMKLDLEFISMKHKTTTIIVIENSEKYKIEHNFAENVQAGNILMRIQRDLE